MGIINCLGSARLACGPQLCDDAVIDRLLDALEDTHDHLLVSVGPSRGSGARRRNAVFATNPRPACLLRMTLTARASLGDCGPELLDVLDAEGGQLRLGRPAAGRLHVELVRQVGRPSKPQ